MKQSHTYQFTIDGMSCAGCAARIEKALQSDAQTEQAAVNFAAKKATVTSKLSAGELKAKIADLGYKATEPASLANLEVKEQQLLSRARFMAVSASLLAVPVVIIGMGSMIKDQTPGFSWSGVVQMLFTAALLFGPGRGFFVRAATQIRHGELTMDSLVSLGTGSTFLFSIYGLLTGHEHLYFESAAVVIVFIVVGKYLEERSRQAISRSLRELAKLQPSTANLLAEPGEESEHERSVVIEQVAVGALLLVRPGDRFPVDGRVRRGSSSVDAAMLTGESDPIDVNEDSLVAAGMENLTAPLVIETTRIGSDTELARIIAMVETAQGTKAPIQKLADRVAARFVPSALGIAIVTFGAWWFLKHDLSAALTAAVAVLVVACPCALGLATPIALMAGTSKAAGRGILVRDAVALQILHKVNAIVFDKTGTLTTGLPVVVDFKLLTSHETQLGWSERAVLRVARQLEVGSNHPMAKAIVRFVDERWRQTPEDQGTGGSSPEVPAFHNWRETAGFGVTAHLSTTGQYLTMARLAALTANVGYDLAEAYLRTSATAGRSYIGLASDGVLIAIFGLQDQIRSEALEGVKALSAMGIKSIMATGDHEAAARAVGSAVGILDMHWEQTPVAKAALIVELRRSGYTVAMAGDGINDAPALAAADVGLAMGSGTDAAMALAGVTLKDNSLAKVVEAIQLSRATFKSIKENLFWAFAYNVLLIPAAACGFLSPMLAGGAMALSSLFVVANALRLLNKPRP